MLPIIVLACTNSLKSLRRVRAGSSILLIPRVCDLQVQVSIYLSAGEGEEVWRHPLKEEKVFAADLDKSCYYFERQEGPEGLPVRLSASVFLEADRGDTICPLVYPRPLTCP